mmetsp:Transcript_13342/g.35809  ORF Transcript_13342/g.35809 Transcript_13342/m.35809 type:complete len:220 (-) Transcript_13342:356-1015(-)
MATSASWKTPEMHPEVDKPMTMPFSSPVMTNKPWPSLARRIIAMGSAVGSGPSSGQGSTVISGAGSLVTRSVKSTKATCLSAGMLTSIPSSLCTSMCATAMTAPCRSRTCNVSCVIAPTVPSITHSEPALPGAGNASSYACKTFARTARVLPPRPATGKSFAPSGTSTVHSKTMRSLTLILKLCPRSSTVMEQETTSPSFRPKGPPSTFDVVPQNTGSF